MARILQVCNNDFYLMHFLAPLVRRLREVGHEVECVCDGADVDYAKLGGNLEIHQLRFPLSNSPREFARVIKDLRAILRRKQFDCVNSHNRSASIVGRIGAWLEQVPVNLYTAHGYYFHDDQSRLVREGTIALEALLARITDYTLSQSDEDAELMLRRGFVRPGTIEIIGNGIDTARFDPERRRPRVTVERELGLRPDRFRIVSTGRIVRAKGFTDVLRAFAALKGAHPNAEFVIVGGNIPRDLEPYQEQFFAMAKALGVSDSVVVTGIVHKVEDYLGVSDVFVLASYREGLPRAMLEAMAMSLPVVVTNIRGCRQVVENGVDGVLFPAHDIDALEKALIELCDDPSLRERLGSAGRAKVRRDFEEGAYVEKQVRAMNRLLGNPKESRFGSTTPAIQTS